MTREGNDRQTFHGPAVDASAGDSRDLPPPQMTAGEAGDPIWEQAGERDGRSQGAAVREEYVPCGRLIELTRPRPRPNPPPQQS